MNFAPPIVQGHKCQDPPSLEASRLCQKALVPLAKLHYMLNNGVISIIKLIHLEHRNYTKIVDCKIICSDFHIIYKYEAIGYQTEVIP